MKNGKMDYLNFLEIIAQKYDGEDYNQIVRAYHRAESLHSGVKRLSGEPYITHPLAVASTLAEMHADADTVCAGLLHDTIEDTNVTKEDLEYEFNSEVAKLVNGVTKLDKKHFKGSEEERESTNTRKVIKGLTKDVRIIIIKLADRLHNMRTLDAQSEAKQKEIAIETLEIYAPLANHIGAYRIQTELEDFALYYLDKDKYKEIESNVERIVETNIPSVKRMITNIHNVLNDNNIPNDIKMTTKNIYSIYKRIYERGETYSDIHDLIGLRILVDDVDECYRTLGYVHSQYKTVNEQLKDYLYNPKVNLYRALHTTVYSPNGRLIQARIRTFDMDKIASYGLTAYWDMDGKNARVEMQKEIKENSAVYKTLTEIDDAFSDNTQFVEKVKKELFSDKVYVYNSEGKIIWLPKGSTVKDFANRTEDDIENKKIKYEVNESEVEESYTLQEKDRVRVLVKDKDIINELTKKELCEYKELLIHNMVVNTDNNLKIDAPVKTLVKEK